MHIFDELKNSEIQHLIDEHIHSQRDREIMKYKLVDNRTAEWIADKFDMNFRTVQRIIARNKKMLSKVYKKP